MSIRKNSPLLSHPEYQAEYSLASELPYWDFFEGPDGACVALSDGSLVRGFRLQGVSVETRDTEQVNQFTQGLRSFLNSLPDGADLQFLYEVDSDYSKLVSEHERLAGDHPEVRWVAENRVASLRESIRQGDLKRPNLYLFVYQRVQTKRGGLSSFFEKPGLFVQSREDEHDKKLHALTQLCTQIVGGLESTGVTAAPLCGAEIQKLIYRLLNPLRSGSEPLPKLSETHRTQEFVAEELKLVPELVKDSPRSQLVFSDLIQGVREMFLDGYYHRVITLKTLPEFTYSALISRLTSLPFHFMLSVQLRVPEQSKELSSLQARRRMAHSMSANHGNRASDLESEAKLHSTEELLRELINTGQKIYYFQTGLLVRARTLDELDLMTKTVLGKFRELNGAEAMAETVAGFKVLKTLLPAGNTTTVRSKRAKTDNLADFLPLYQPWEGTGSPVCLFKNRASGLIAYDPFDPELPNYNTLVTGSSGAGKSFLNNCILLQFLTQKPLVYIIDIGGSYRKLCEFMRGQYIEIAPPQAGEIAQAINPLLLPEGASEPSPQKIKFLISFLESILTDEEGDKLPKLDKSLLEEVLLATYQKCLPSRMPRLYDLRSALEQAPDDRLKQFSKILYPWTGSRPYGRLLDTEHALDLTADMVVFDLKGLASYPDLQSAMILIITDFILGKIDQVSTRRKLILMDECWELLKSRGAVHFMEYCARTLRKTGSGITFITQGLEEIERSPIGPAILNNTATKMSLTQRGDLEPIRKILKLNDQEMALISSLRQQKGVFSEAFLIANDHRAVIRLTPTPVEYWLATSDAADNALLAQARDEGPEKSLPQIVHELAMRFPGGAARGPVHPDRGGGKS